MPRILVIAALGAALAGCAALTVREPLSATLSSVTPVEMSLLEQKFLVKVRVLNPNDTPIEFDGVVFDLELNGEPFAKGVSDQKGVVPRYGEAQFDVTVVSGLQGIVRQINALASGGRESLTYRVKGRLGSGMFGGVPFESKGELKFPSAPASAPKGT